MKLDILTIAVHPDDAELGCSGTLIKHVQLGWKVGILDLTKGELGTRGTPEIRVKEAEEAAKILGLKFRDQLDLKDGFFENREEQLRKIIPYIRAYQPKYVIINAPEDRHPDHGLASALASRACFLSGLRKIESSWDGVIQEAYRPERVFKFIQDRYLKPTFVVDVTRVWPEKLKAIKAYKSQFYTEKSASDEEPPTYISSRDFIDFIESRAMEFGHSIGVKYGEGFIDDYMIPVKDFSIFD